MNGQIFLNTKKMIAPVNSELNDSRDAGQTLPKNVKKVYFIFTRKVARMK